MRNTIKKILREERLSTPMFDYVRKVAELIAYNDIDVDIENKMLTIPFTGGFGEDDMYFNSEPFNRQYKDGYWGTNELLIYVLHQYGLDLMDKRGILQVLYKLIHKNVYKRVTDEIKKESLNESKESNFISKSAEYIHKQIKLDDDGAVLDVPWPHIKTSSYGGIWLVSDIIEWVESTFGVDYPMAVNILVEFSSISNIQILRRG